MSLERDSLESYLARLEERIKVLETAPRIIRTSQRGGTFTLIPPDGSPSSLMTFGEFGDEEGNNAYGVSMYGKSGQTLLSVVESEEGLIAPHQHHMFVQANTSIAVTAGAYTTTWELGWEYTWHECWKIQFAVATGAGTTASVRLKEAFSGQTTNALSIGAAASGTAVFEWLHPFNVGWGDPSGLGATFLLQIEAKRDSGANALNIFTPFLLERGKGFSPSANSTGNPHLA
jgi:hypothetical protein